MILVFLDLEENKLHIAVLVARNGEAEAHAISVKVFDAAERGIAYRRDVAVFLLQGLYECIEILPGIIGDIFDLGFKFLPLLYADV